MDTSKSTSNQNPRENANCISISLFWWTVGFFKKGYCKKLGMEDLSDPLSTDRSSVLGDRLEKQWRAELQNGEKRNRQPSLLKAIFRTFRSEIFLIACIKLVNDCILRLGTPILLGELLQYFKPKPMTTYENALIYAGGMSLVIAISVITMNQYIYLTNHLGGKVRISVCSLAYRKALCLSKTALGEMTPGKLVNLMANDVYSFDSTSVSLHNVWSFPLSALIVGYFMYTEAGYAGLIGIAFVFVVIFFQAYAAKLISKFRLQTAIKTDERVRLMDEIISGVQMIKMYAWEKPFCVLVELARRLELNVIRKSSYIRGIFITCNLFTAPIALFGTLITLMLTGEKLNADKVFVFYSYFVLLAFSIGSMFVRGVAEMTESLVAVKRLQNFLTCEEFQASNVIPLVVSNGSGNADSSNKNYQDERKKSWSVKLDLVTAKWNLNSSETTLEDIELKVEQGKLYIVIGMVAAGKSSLLSAILGELNLLQGNVRVNGEISYASQEAWVFGSSVRQNILFGQEYDRQRYQDVVKTCDLLKDFKQFPHGDQSIVSERGSSLSGGQKARINLARAIYRQADIYLLDDPLSAVDAHVGKHLFKECLQKYLRGKTRVLVTHQLQFIKEADSIILMNQGRICQYSDYHDLLNAHPQYSCMITAKRGNVGDDCSAEVSHLKRQISSASTISRPWETSEENTDGEENPSMLDDSMEGTTHGTVKGNLMIRYFQAGSSIFLCILLMFLFLLTQFVTSLNDYFISIIIEAEESRFCCNDFYYRETLIPNSELITNSSSMILEENTILPMDYYIYIYAVIVLSILVIGTIRSLFFCAVCLSSSQQLHDLIFGALIRTTMRFFDTNSSGRILNRFSKDLGTIDDLLPKTMLEAVQIILTISGSIVVCCTVNSTILIPLLFISIIFYWIRRIYLKTSKTVKRLEGISRAPVFTHLNTTINGISTIRAFRAQKLLVQEFDKFQDVHTSSWYTFMSCSMAFALSLDFICYVFISLVTFSFLILKESFSGGQVGLVISQLMTMSGTLQWGVRQTTEVTNQMTSVERVLEYADLTPEANLRDTVFSAKRNKKHVKSEEKLALIEPSEGWPSAGSVNFQNVYMRYSGREAPVLKNLTFTVRPSEKVGIVGRTGAGKSSLISALFRLATVKGLIEIDGIDTGRIALEDLRKHISIIPQDPVLFSGTLRRNLDPFNECPDELLWEILEDVELKDAVIAMGHGLDNRVLDRGSNYSVGQRQLVCLARAILRNNRVLVLDEATANVDPHTDALIQRSIRTKFALCTVLTVAHRLNTIMDSDKVLVMDRGHVMEYDHPYVLLQNEDGPFALLAKETGPAMFQQLFKVARDAYIAKHGDSQHLRLS